MFISDIEARRKQMLKIAFTYLIISLFCALFGAVYEHFSHGVYSGYMIYAFAFPLAGGAIPLTAASVYNCKLLPARLSLNLYNAGIAALTVGSIMEGVLEIYGTTNGLIKIYWFIGIGLSAAGLTLYAIGIIKTLKNKNKI